MKKLKPAFSVVGSLTMALTLASPALAETSIPEKGSKVEVFKEDANAKEGKNPVYGPDDKVGKLVTENIQVENNDWDNDGIPNDLEKNGYKIEFNQQTGKNEARAWDSEKDKGKLKFISNPMSANSDGDPFTDMYEVENYNNDSDIDFNPIVANIPNLQIGVKRIEVIPIATITDSNGGSISRGWEKSVSTQHSFNVGLTGTGGAEGSATGPVPSGSVSANVGYGYSKTTTETERYSNDIDWSTATTVDTTKAAKLRVHLEYKNTGTASAENVSPHFNIRLGNKIIQTVKAEQNRYKANYLSTEKGGRDKTEVVIDSLEGQADANIVLSLDELKAVEQGELLSIEVLPTSTMELSAIKDGKVEKFGDSGIFQARVNAATEQLETDIGNKPKFNIYTPKNPGNPVLSYNEVFRHANIDTNKVNHIVDKAKGNKLVSVVSATNQPDVLEGLKTGQSNRGYLHNDSTHGAFENLQPPTLANSSYDPITKKLRASIVPGLFGASNEITASFKNKKSGQVQQVKLVKHQNSYLYESRENIKLNEFSPSEAVTFEINDALKKLPTNKVSTVVNYNKEFDSYLLDESGEFIVEGTPYFVSVGSGNNRNPYDYWGRIHASNKWEYLGKADSKSAASSIVIERSGQPKPGKPIKKDEEVLIKFTNTAYSNYQYLKLQDGYVHLDQKQNASIFKINPDSFATTNTTSRFFITSDGNYIMTHRKNYKSYLSYETTEIKPNASRYTYNWRLTR
ncbi:MULTISPECIES: binary toxin-like calcium binding domain-containing protein [unclassified Bacillus (in: firmicutes)]|uniref:binary toxin-like calcium binding domain-containing protein n=1 Tax=unclassified Bacillus (in: firmicutes) TaxID=185979 RepID=UPI0008F2B2AA|nr:MULTISPECIES: binary toxin-like calcium binding domain-containing protein [unclassified Bacillus (in: firmicutes)]SFK01476.1 binary toxin B/toxin PA [Bacillus sp. 71mf]SFT22872.1 binary toxin B/toxin PA [Bacillus sp. 103mf]